MSKWSYVILMFSWLLVFSTSLYATGEVQHQQVKLPDGNTEIDLTDTSGTKTTLITHPDGSSISTAVDQSGNTTITTEHADGSIDVATKWNI